MTTTELSDISLLPTGSRIFKCGGLTAQTASETTVFELELNGRKFHPTKGGWKTNAEGMQNLLSRKRLYLLGNTPSYVRYLEDFPAFALTNMWTDTGIAGFGDPKIFVVQTNKKVVERCILMTTDPGDLVMDVTCGSGTTAVVAEQWGRRWITCDTSRVAVTLAKQRLMTSVFDYYELAHPEEGVGSGFRYKSVQHVTLKSIANNEPPAQETLYDQPFIDNTKTRVTVRSPSKRCQPRW